MQCHFQMMYNIFMLTKNQEISCGHPQDIFSFGTCHLKMPKIYSSSSLHFRHLWLKKSSWELHRRAHAKASGPTFRQFGILTGPWTYFTCFFCPDTLLWLNKPFFFREIQLVGDIFFFNPWYMDRYIHHFTMKMDRVWILMSGDWWERYSWWFLWFRDRWEAKNCNGTVDGSTKSG